MHCQKYTLAVSYLFLTLTAAADVPVTFQAGTPARAAEVNQNFASLDARINASLGGLFLRTVSASSDTSTGVVSASCPTNELVGSANCDCNNANGTRNFGVLFACVIAGNGGLAGCFSDSGTFNQFLPPPRATVEVVCVSGVTNDGSPIIPTFSLGSGAAVESIKMNSDTTKNKVVVDKLDTALKTAQEQESDFNARVQSRQP